MKVGDRVKFVKYIKPLDEDSEREARLGETAVVTQYCKSTGYSISLKFDGDADEFPRYGFKEEELELIEEVNTIEFKVGDKVEIIKGKYCHSRGFEVGTKGTIVFIDSDTDQRYRVAANGLKLWQSADEMKLVTEGFTKDDLKEYMLVQVKTNEWGIISKLARGTVGIVFSDGGKISLSHYDSDLTDNVNRVYDIVKVATFEHLGDFIKYAKGETNIEDANGFKVIYQRESAEVQQVKQEIADLKAQLETAEKKLGEVA